MYLFKRQLSQYMLFFLESSMISSVTRSDNERDIWFKYSLFNGQFCTFYNWMWWVTSLMFTLCKQLSSDWLDDSDARFTFLRYFREETENVEQKKEGWRVLSLFHFRRHNLSREMGNCNGAEQPWCKEPMHVCGEGIGQRESVTEENAKTKLDVKKL